MRKILASMFAATLMTAAFSGCGGTPAAEQVLPQIEETAIEDFEYEYDAEHGGMAITAYLAKSPKVKIPDTIEDYPVVGADLGDADITHLYLPDTLVWLECNNDYIEYANYPNSELGSVFSGSSALKEIYIEADSLPKEAFYYCLSLTEVTFGSDVTSIDPNAFGYCTSLESINLPDSVNHIADTIYGTIYGNNNHAFYECRNLTNATYKGETYSYKNLDELYDAINEQ